MNLVESSVTSGHKVDPTKGFPEPQNEKYWIAQAGVLDLIEKLHAGIVCFIDIHDNKVSGSQFREIIANLRKCEDISNYLKGKYHYYVTEVDKNKRSFSEIELFIPAFEYLGDNKQSLINEHRRRK
jgi:hypothetical protein